MTYSNIDYLFAPVGFVNHPKENTSLEHCPRQHPIPNSLKYMDKNQNEKKRQDKELLDRGIFCFWLVVTKLNSLFILKRAFKKGPVHFLFSS